VLGRNRQRLAGIGPFKGMSKVRIPGVDKAMNEGSQILGGADTSPAQALTTQDREPHLDLVEPRAMGGQPVESNLRALSGAPI